jgi:hypothetical protein
MKTRFYLGYLSSLALLVNSCGSTFTVSDLEPVNEEHDAGVSGGDRHSASLSSEFLVPPGADSLLSLPVSPLISTTKPSERLPQITLGRSDPFAPIEFAPTDFAPVDTGAPSLWPTSSNHPQPGQAIPTVPIAGTPVLPAIPIATGSAASPPSEALNPSTQAPVSLKSSSDLSSERNFVTSPPTEPVPLSHTLEISGVVQLSGRTSVIVRVPDERNSRYVRIGDRLANGQVLVKRIELDSASEPIVILEQDGIEVRRMVGSSGRIELGSL